MNKFLIITVCLICGVLCKSHPSYAQQNKPKDKPVIDERYQREVKALSEKPQVKTAFKTIIDLESETLRDHITLTEIPAPPFKENARADKFLAMLREAGIDSSWIDKEGNVIALRKGQSGKKTVLVEAHLDTVFPEGTDVTVKQKGDTLFAPGIGDDSRGLAVVLTLLKTINKTKIQTDANILFVGTVGEEGLGDLRGVKALFNDKKIKIDSYICLDVEGYSTIVHGGVGSTRYRVTFKGPGGHSYGAFGTVNPHNALARAIHYFVEQADPYTRQGVPTTYNIGVIGGGSSVNAIPEASWMEVDMRSEDPQRLKVLDGYLQSSILKGLKEENEMKRKGLALTVDIKQIGSRPAGIQNLSLPLLQRSMAAVKFLGGDPHLLLVSTNSNFPISKGVPSVTIGVGGQAEGAHSLKEWWLNDKGYLGIQNALLILLAEAGIK